MYTEYQPSHLLVPYIDNYWEFKGNPDYGMRIHILPDGCTDFIFTLGEVANAVEEGSLMMQPYRSYFVGPMTKYSELVTYAESVHMFGVRFLPCGLSCFTNLPLHEFVNSRINANEMKAVFDDTFIERLCEQKSYCRSNTSSGGIFAGIFGAPLSACRFARRYGSEHD